ncbi:hypothetical protein V5259_16020, partial [Pectobacterium carotovorum]
ALMMNLCRGSPYGPTLALFHLLRKMVRRYAIPSAYVTAIRAASDAFTRPINGARPSGQHKCCSKRR